MFAGTETLGRPEGCQCLIRLVTGRKGTPKRDPSRGTLRVESGGTTKVSLRDMVALDTVIVGTYSKPGVRSFGRGFHPLVRQSKKHARVSEQHERRDVAVDYFFDSGVELG